MKIILTILLLLSISFNAFAEKPEQIYKKAVAQYSKGDFEEAVKTFDELLKKVQDYASYYYRGMSYLAIGEYDKAQNDFTMSIALKSDNADAYNGRALAFGYLDNVGASMLDFNKAIQLDPKFAEAYANRATAYIAQKKFDLAEKDLRKTLNLRGDHKPAQLNLARLIYSKGQFENAIKEFDKCVKIGLDLPEVYLKRGKSFYALKKFQKAAEDFTKAIKLEPRDPQLYIARANTYEKLGKKDLAEKDRKDAATAAEADYQPMDDIRFDKYITPDKVFTLQLPEKWHFDQIQRDDDVTEYIYTKFPKGSNNINDVMVSAAIVRDMAKKYDVKGSFGIIEFWDGSIGKNVMSYAHHVTNQQVQKSRNGLPTRLYKSTLQYTENSIPMVVYEYATATDNDLAYLVMRCPADQFGYYEKIFDQVIETLSIKWK